MNWRVRVVPFLVRVLRAGTPAEKDDPGDWEPSIHLTWSKHRAAEALSLRAGVPCEFRRCPRCPRPPFPQAQSG